MAKTTKRGGKSGGKNLSAKDAGSMRGGATRNLGSRRADAVKGGVAKKPTWK
jgi:hypothetical protein